MITKENGLRYAKLIHVSVDEEGNPIPISTRVKNRYAERMKKYGKGILSFEEIEKEKLEQNKDVK